MPQMNVASKNFSTMYILNSGTIGAGDNYVIPANYTVLGFSRTATGELEIYFNGSWRDVYTPDGTKIIGDQNLMELFPVPILSDGTNIRIKNTGAGDCVYDLLVMEYL